MRIDTILTPAELPALARRDLRETACIVFDVLRATSTFVTALHNGAKAIIPVREISEALTFKNAECGMRNAESILLGGERDGVKIRAVQTGGTDFDLGNSPRECTPEKVRGKTIVSTTTNGTRALRACAGAKTVLAGSFLNLGATAAFINKLQPAEVLLVCAGTREDRADEDVLAAGALCEILDAPFSPSLLGAPASRRPVGNRKPELAGETPALPGMTPRLKSSMRDYSFRGILSPLGRGEGFLQMTESAEIARHFYAQAKSNLAAAVCNATNARRLLAIPELRDDVAFCLQRDVFPLIARMEADGAIRRQPA